MNLYVVRDGRSVVVKMFYLYLCRMNLYLFNPENDLALANNDPHFIPPRSARKMAADMCMLPAWWMRNGDVLCGAEGLYASSMRLQEDSLGVCPSFGWMDENTGCRPERICPWGWSPLLLTRLRGSGIPDVLLPSQERMEEYRRLSGRQTAARWLEAFRLSWGGEENFSAAGFCGKAVACHTEDDIQCCLSRWPETLLKAPWSGSGKGLRLGRGGYVSPLDGWCRRLLRTQGCVMVEPLYHKELDFGMEFYCDGCGTVRYEGLSLFHTNQQGAYVGSRLATEETLRAVLGRYVPLESVDVARRFLQSCLEEEVAGIYEGYCGVDMMVCRQTDRYVVHPCVELNLRMTMGMVAIHLSRRLARTSEGIFRVTYSNDPAALRQWYARQQQAAPRGQTGGKVVAGYWPLTPVVAGTSYHAYMDVHPLVT
ncbi:MAG: hypothetical protein K2N13_09245 [Paraprevotella sp.]|nr:hypothetical protein [Paraprevotella sp.]